LIPSPDAMAIAFSFLIASAFRKSKLIVLIVNIYRLSYC